MKAPRRTASRNFTPPAIDDGYIAHALGVCEARYSDRVSLLELLGPEVSERLRAIAEQTEARS